MYCGNCGKENEDSARFCCNCARPLNDAPPPSSGPQQAAQRGVIVVKSPAAAVVFSVLILGLGQLYNGDWKKTLLMWGVFFVFAPVTFGLDWFLLLMWSAVDAYMVAKGQWRKW